MMPSLRARDGARFSRRVRRPRLERLESRIVLSEWLSLALPSTSLGEGDAPMTVTVSRTGDTTAALVVTLASTDTTELWTPATVTIPAGQASATFDVDAVSDALIDGAQAADLSAAAAGYTGDVKTITIPDDDAPGDLRIGGHLDGALAAGTYRVTKSLTIDLGRSLSIDPGATLRFDAATRLSIQGSLTADGTAAQPIVLTSSAATPAPGDWLGVTAWLPNTVPTLLDHVEIGYASTGLYVSSNGGDPSFVLSGSRVHHSFGTGVMVESTPLVYLSPTEVQILGNEIDHNAYGVILRSYANGLDSSTNAATVSDNDIHDNSAAGVSLAAINGPFYAVPARYSVVAGEVSRNHIHHNGHGLTTSTATSNNVMEIDTTIASNLIADNTLDGMHLDAAAAEFLDTRVVNNTIVRNGGAGIWHDADADPAAGFVIRNNLIAGNTGAGIQADAAFAPPAGAMGYNLLWNNAGGAWVNYPAAFGTITTVNANGTPSDAEFNIAADPLFVSAGDDHIQGASPARYAGTATGAPATDIDGETRLTPIDIGADEVEGDPDLLLVAMTTNGFNALTITYEIRVASPPALDIAIARSADSVFGVGDTTLATISLSLPADLTIGTHTKTYTLGAEAGQIPLPGAGAPEVDSDYYLLGVIDPADVVSEPDSNNTVVYSGVYHLPLGDVFAHGTSANDIITVNYYGFYLSGVGPNVSYSHADVGAFRIRGHDGNDAIAGENVTHSMRFWGGDGDDTLTGGAMADTLDGGAGGDLWKTTGTTADDKMVYAKDTLASTLKLTFGTTIDRFVYDAADRIYAYGWMGNDKITAPSNVSIPVTFEGGDGNDVLTGGPAADSLTGGNGNDTVYGKLGDDTIDGGTGTDTLVIEGTAAADFLDADRDGGTGRFVSRRRASAGGAVLETDLAAGFEKISTRSMGGNDSIDYSGLDAGEFAALGLSGITLDGGSGDDTITGSGGKDSLTGGVGDDELNGGDGDDSLNGSAGNDIVDGGAGTDQVTIQGTAAADFLDADRDAITGRLVVNRRAVAGGPVVEVDGVSGEKIVIKGLDGGDAIDLTAVDAADYAALGLVAVTLDGGNGNDSINGGGGKETLLGGNGDDTLNGGDGNDSINGGAGADVWIALGTSAADLLDVARTSSTKLTLKRSLRAVPTTILQTTAFSHDAFDQVLLQAGDDDDLIQVATTITIDGTVDGGTGTDTCTAPAGWARINCE